MAHYDRGGGEEAGASPVLPPRVTIASIEGTFTQAETAGGARPRRVSGPPRHRSPLRVIARGFTWVTASQVITAGGNLVLTPFVIHGLGIQRYGLFVLMGTITAFLGSLNGGLAETANRYFPIYAGADDRVATTRLLVTLLLFVAGLGSVVSIVDWFVSPVVIDALSMSPNLRPESLFLLRTLGFLLVFGMAHQVVQAVVLARQRFDRAIQAGFLCWVLWVVGLVLVVENHYGLRGVAVVFMVQQVATVAVIAPTSVQYLTREGLSLMAWRDVREVLSFSGKLQVTGFAGLINNQLDTLIVGSALSVRTVGIYNSGNSFSGQLTSVASNVIAPASVALGNTFGRDGAERAFQQFNRMQRNWVAGVTGWSAVGAASAYFAVTAWLGPQFKLGGWVALVAIAGGVFSLGAAMASTFVTVMRQVGLEMRYGLVQMAANILLTLPLAAIGALEVAIGAAVAQAIAAVYLVRGSRRHLRHDMPNFLRQMPVARGLVAAAVTVVLEFLVRPYIVTGPVGLLECVPPAAIGMCVFGVLMAGPRRAVALSVAVVRQRRLPRGIFAAASPASEATNGA